MAGIDVTEEFVATAGMIATAPAGSTGPTSAESTLDAAFVDHGLVSADGVTRTENRTMTPRYAWQNNTRLRDLVTQGEVQIQCVLVQSSIENIELYFGDEVGVDGSVISNPQRQMPLISVVYDQTDGDNIHREYIPQARITEKGDQVALAGDNIGWNVTITSVFDDSLGDEGGHSQLWFSELAGS